MRKIHFLFVFLLISAIGSAQTPNSMNYQAVARDAGGVPVTNATIKVRFSFTNALQTIVWYRESHTITTGTTGLFSLIIGNGNIEAGNMPNIPWSNGGIYIYTEYDFDNNGSYDANELKVMLTVPYARNADKVDDLSTAGATAGQSAIWSAGNSRFEPGHVQHEWQQSFAGGQSGSQSVINQWHYNASHCPTITNITQTGTYMVNVGMSARIPLSSQVFWCVWDATTGVPAFNQGIIGDLNSTGGPVNAQGSGTVIINLTAGHTYQVRIWSTAAGWTFGAPSTSNWMNVVRIN